MMLCIHNQFEGKSIYWIKSEESKRWMEMFKFIYALCGIRRWFLQHGLALFGAFHLTLSRAHIWWNKIYEMSTGSLSNHLGK